MAMETQLGSVPLNTDESPVKRAIMVVALVVMLAGMWFLRDLALMPIGKKYSKDDIEASVARVEAMHMSMKVLTPAGCL